MGDERINFKDVDGRDAFAVVRPEGEHVRLVVSILEDGDYDVTLGAEEAIRLAEALSRSAAKEGA